MLTRSERNKLIQKGIQCDFLEYYPKPVAKIRIKKNYKNTVSKSHRSPLMACYNNNETQSDEMGMVGKIEDAVDCVDKPQYISVVDSKSMKTGYSSTLESSNGEEEVKPILNYTLIPKPKKDGHSKTCYCDFIILPPTQPVMPPTILSNVEEPMNLPTVKISARLNRSSVISKANLLDKSVPMLAVRPTLVNAPTPKELNLLKQELNDSILHSDVNTIYPESLIEDSKVDDWWFTSFQTTQQTQRKSKVEILEILCLPPGTIDPLCPIDIYNQPLDLSIKRELETSCELLDLSVRSGNQAFKIKPYSKPIDVLVASPQESYDEDEVLFLDSSYANFKSSDTVSERADDCGSHSLSVCISDIQQKLIFYEDQELHNSDFKPSIVIPVFSAEDNIRRRVYEILNYPCLRYFAYGTCTKIPCKFQHNLVEAEELQVILMSEPIIIIEKCYALVHQFDSLFHKYFQIFCIVFGQNQMIKFLIGMIKHCEWPKRPVSFYRHIIQGLQLCKLDEITCFTHLIQNSTLKSPKSFNILIWIMVDLDVVLKFRNKLNEYLRHEGFYISAPNLTRLLGVCSRTKNCELIRIIYEAIENYPAKVKEQLHWNVRPKYLRLKSEVLKSTRLSPELTINI